MKICPKNKNHKRFLTTAIECHDWLVDSQGNFVDDRGCTEVYAKPEDGNVWTCATCGADAISEEVMKIVRKKKK